MVKDEHSALKASFERALEFLNAGDHIMAEKICRRAIKEVSNSDPNIQVLLCVSLIRQGRSGSAVKRLKHILRSFPDFAPHMKNWAMVFWLRINLIKPLEHSKKHFNFALIMLQQ